MSDVFTQWANGSPSDSLDVIMLKFQFRSEGRNSATAVIIHFSTYLPTYLPTYLINSVAVIGGWVISTCIHNVGIWRLFLADGCACVSSDGLSSWTSWCTRRIHTEYRLACAPSLHASSEYTDPRRKYAETLVSFPVILILEGNMLRR